MRCNAYYIVCANPAFSLIDCQWVCAEGSSLSAFSLVSFHLHHAIHIPQHRMHSLRTDECQCLAELVGVHPSHHFWETIVELMICWESLYK